MRQSGIILHPWSNSRDKGVVHACLCGIVALQACRSGCIATLEPDSTLKLLEVTESSLCYCCLSGLMVVRRGPGEGEQEAR